MAQVTLKSCAFGDADELRGYAIEAGKRSGAGQRSILELGRAVYATAKTYGLEDGDIGAVYLAYAEGQNDGADPLTPKVDVSNKDVMNNGATKLRLFAKLARVKGRGEFFNVVPMTVRAVGKGSSYEAVVKVIRAQLKAVKEGATRPFTQTEISAVLAPKAKDFEVVAKLTSIRKGVLALCGQESALTVIEQAPFVELAAFIQAQIKSYVDATSNAGDQSIVEDFDEETNSESESPTTEDLGSELADLLAHAA